MDKKPKLSSISFLSRIKYVKNIEIYIVVIALLVMLLIYTGGKSEAVSASSQTMNEEEFRLAQTLSKIKGVGECQVYINYDSNDGDLKAEIEKCVIVATGATDVNVKIEIINMVSFALKLDLNQVEVFEMNK